MNDDVRLERLIADGLHELAPRRAPDRLRTQVKAETGESRPRARWLALIKESPMRSNSRLAVGSPTARVVAIMAATLLAALLVVSAGVAGAQLFAANGPIVVDQAGGGAFTTIAEAVDHAEDGDEIVVMPGTYVEAVVIDKAILLRGGGPREEVIMTAPEDGPTSALWEGVFDADPYALLVTDADATISGLTFAGERSEVFLVGASPRLEDSVFNGVGWAFDGSLTSPRGSSVVITGGGSPTVVGNEIIDGGPIGVFDGSNPLIEDNALAGGPHIYLASFGDAVIAENVITGTHQWAIGSFYTDGHARIEGNVIDSPGEMGINLSSGSADILANEITGAELAGIATGIQPATVSGNRLSGNSIAISAAAPGAVTDNVVRDGGAGISISSGGSVQVTGNDIEGMEGGGLVLIAGSHVLRDNHSCGNGQNLVIGANADPDVDDSNDICEDAPA